MSLIKDECNAEYLVLVDRFLRENGLALVRVQGAGDMALPSDAERKCEICDKAYDILNMHWYDDRQCVEKLKSLFKQV